MLDVHRLRLLRELDRRGTLAAVAQALNYSPSAISQQLSLLETETGATLLERVGRGVRLTGQARILVRHAEAILERMELAEAELAASMTEVTGALRVASFQSVLLALVPAALSRLAAEHPGLRVEFTQAEAGSAFAGLLARDFDVVLGEDYPGLSEPRLPGVDEEDLLHDEMRVAVPTSGPWHCARLADLAGAPFVFDPDDVTPGRWARQVCRGAGFEPDVRFRSGDLLLQLRLVETGHAVAFVPDLLWTDRAPGDLELHPLPGRPRRRLYTGVRSGSAGQPAIRAFRAALHRKVQE
ncbi:LysR family transcriptional regulator [Couchioplanes caeruleus]|uniref:LysR family transcriptional regulator n=2 Tax=Couchioplanes caeruleus TaxID=56438 RepID=A0A1K0GHU7_9ACTN|nr:LysR family transcriptional regulator [Couchioplanes caeruleus]OJF11806.1 LysR family transcriptional regulator [Couchioplanes caeruleus subsp. caeruleus]ROP32426.1 DNA-binding transcriptional LysR family regulator [Couchioplanes caeruleus]